MHTYFNNKVTKVYPTNKKQQVEEVFYECRTSTLSATAPSWTPTYQVYDINNEGFEETKGEEATREADQNEQQNNRGFDKNTLIGGWRGWNNLSVKTTISYKNYYKKILPSSARSKNGWKNLLNIYIDDIVNEHKNSTDKKMKIKLSNKKSYLNHLNRYLDTL